MDAKSPAQKRALSRAKSSKSLDKQDVAIPGDRGIGDLQIGNKLRYARRMQGMRLKELALRVGCSESMLSKVENEHVRPSLTMLHKLASELGTSIGALFSAPIRDKSVIMRKADRPSISTKSAHGSATAAVRLECLMPDPMGKLLYASIHVVEPGEGSEGALEHWGEEVGYVIEGELELTVDGQTYHLQEGDSFFFNSNLPHGYLNPGRVQSRIIWVNTPSTF